MASNLMKQFRDRSKGLIPPAPKLKSASLDRGATALKDALSKPFKATPVVAKPVTNIPGHDPVPQGCEQFEVEGYSFYAESGYKQVIDPQTGELSGKFIFDDEDPEHLELRGRQILLDKTIKQVQEQLETLKRELSRLEMEKDKVENTLKQLPMKRRSDFSLCLNDLQPVSILLPAEEESRELAYRCEAIARDLLPTGANYNVIQSGEFQRKPNIGHDPSIWVGWQTHLRSESYHIGSLIIRRKYIPDTGQNFQDFILIITSYSDAPLQTDEFLQPLRRIAGSVHPLNVPPYDKIDIQVKMDRLDTPEGYLRWFSRHMRLQPQWHTQAHRFCLSLAALLAGELPLSQLSVPEKSGVIIRPASTTPSASAAAAEKETASLLPKQEDEEEKESEEIGDPWPILIEMCDDKNNALVYEFQLEQYWKETPDSAEMQQQMVARYREEWLQRLAAYLAICADGFVVTKLQLRNIARVVEDPKTDPAVKYMLERILDFFLLIRKRGQSYKGSIPLEKLRDQVAMSNSQLNEDVLCKLLKCGYIKRTLETDGGAAAYSRLLGCLLQREESSLHLLASVAREIAAIAAHPIHKTVLLERQTLYLWFIT